jgi:hypothetical protein
MTREFLKNCNIPSVGKPVISQVFFYFHRIKNTMTTTQNYNPLRNALVELTTTEALRWYRTQAKTTATLAQTIAFRSITTAQRLLSDRHRFAIAPAIAEPELAKAPHPAVPDDGDAVVGLENAISPQQEYASTEATEPEESPVSNDWEEIAPTIAPEPDDSEGDRIAIDELEQAISSTELQQAITLSDAEAIELKPSVCLENILNEV